MNLPTKKLTKIAILGALSWLIMLFEIPLPFIPPFLKIDFSEIPALLAAFALGPVSAVAVELIKNLLHLFNTTTAGIGELANFAVGVAYVIPAALIYQHGKSKKGAVVSLTAATLCLVVFASIFNYFVLLPLYAKVLHFPVDAVVALGTAANKSIVDVKTLIALGIAPFNLIKGVIVSVIVLAIYKKLSPILHVHQ